MRAAFFAIVATVLASAPALAACPAVPDSNASNYVRNGVNRSLCLQQQLNADTRNQAVQTQIENQLKMLQQDIRNQQLQVDLRNDFFKP